MPKYKVLIARSAEKQLRKLPDKIRDRLAREIVQLGDDPFPFGSKKLSGTESSYRIRIGDYRVIYEIEYREVIVLVLKIGHRKDVYR